MPALSKRIPADHHQLQPGEADPQPERSALFEAVEAALPSTARGRLRVLAIGPEHDASLAWWRAHALDGRLELISPQPASSDASAFRDKLLRLTKERDDNSWDAIVDGTEGSADERVDLMLALLPYLAPGGLYVIPDPQRRADASGTDSRFGSVLDAVLCLGVLLGAPRRDDPASAFTHLQIGGVELVPGGCIVRASNPPDPVANTPALTAENLLIGALSSIGRLDGLPVAAGESHEVVGAGILVQYLLRQRTRIDVLTSKLRQAEQEIRLREAEIATLQQHAKLLEDGVRAGGSSAIRPLSQLRAATLGKLLLRRVAAAAVWRLRHVGRLLGVGRPRAGA